MTTAIVLNGQVIIDTQTSYGSEPGVFVNRSKMLFFEIWSDIKDAQGVRISSSACYPGWIVGSVEAANIAMPRIRDRIRGSFLRVDHALYSPDAWSWGDKDRDLVDLLAEEDTLVSLIMSDIVEIDENGVWDNGGHLYLVTVSRQGCRVEPLYYTTPQFFGSSHSPLTRAILRNLNTDAKTDDKRVAPTWAAITSYLDPFSGGHLEVFDFEVGHDGVQAKLAYRVNIDEVANVMFAAANEMVRDL